MSIIFLIVSIVLILCDAYIVFGVFGEGSWWLKGLAILPTVFYLIFIIWVLCGKEVGQFTLNMLFWLTLCIVIPTLLFTLISLIGKAVGLAFPSVTLVVNCVAAFISVAWIGFSLFGIIYGWKRLSVEEVRIHSPKIPISFNGYRIIQLSDFHIGTYSSAPDCVRRIVEKVNSLNPDLIVFTGDLVNSSSSEVKEFTDLLSQLHAKDGVYAVLGNHDYCLYRNYYGDDTPEKELTKVIELEKMIGWRLLRNESVQISRGGDEIAIIGVDNAGSRMFPDKSDLKGALNDVPQDEFKILLTHDPSHWRREVLPKTDIDLTLSGHTHAMQFKIGNWSPSSWIYPEWGGLYDEKGRRLYVSTGIGENIAFRFGAWPQIVVITLSN